MILLALVAWTYATAQSPIADGKEKFLGNVYSSSQLPEFEQYWNQVTPENAGKWGSVERTRDSYNWTTLDASYNYARENGFVFRYHVMIWGNQQPSWIEDLPAEEQLEEITEWMDTLAARYPDIEYLEVVNEPINDPPNGEGNGNYMNALGGTGETGYDWIITAFRMARERFPDAKLVINEYNIVNSTGRSNLYITLANLLKDEGLLDVVGVQAHAFSTTATTTTLETILDKLATETGLDLMVTEFDIDGPSNAVQKEEYERIFPIFWEHPSVVGVTLWGFRPGMWRTDQKAYLIDTDGSERPALQWLRSYVENYDPNAAILETDPTRALRLYPNPVSNGAIRLENIQKAKAIKIINMAGAEMAYYPLKGSKSLKLDFDFPSGVYSVLVDYEDRVIVKKVIVN